MLPSLWGKKLLFDGIIREHLKSGDNRIFRVHLRSIDIDERVYFGENRTKRRSDSSKFKLCKVDDPVSVFWLTVSYKQSLFAVDADFLPGNGNNIHNSFTALYVVVFIPGSFLNGDKRSGIFNGGDSPAQFQHHHSIHRI